MNEITKKVQALIFLSAEPVSRNNIQKSLNIQNDQLDLALSELKKHTASTGIELLDDGKNLQLAACSSLLAQKDTDVVGVSTLSSSALEVLAIIAYRQPISRQDIEEIRGITAAQSLRGLIEKELIVEKRHKKAGINYLEYVTDISFLRFMGIKDLSELLDYKELA